MLDPVDVERLVDRLGQAPAERDRRALVDVLAHDDELVAAEPRDGVVGPHRAAAVARLDRTRVTGRVPVEVVDRLKSSRSMNSTQAAPLSRSSAPARESSRSRHSARFASPVSGSCSAS